DVHDEETRDADGARGHEQRVECVKLRAGVESGEPEKPEPRQQAENEERGDEKLRGGEGPPELAQGVQDASGCVDSAHRSHGADPTPCETAPCAGVTTL